LSAL
jgi:hypothetical protein